MIVKLAWRQVSVWSSHNYLDRRDLEASRRGKERWRDKIGENPHFPFWVSSIKGLSHLGSKVIWSIANIFQFLSSLLLHHLLCYFTARPTCRWSLCSHHRNLGQPGYPSLWKLWSGLVLSPDCKRLCMILRSFGNMPPPWAQASLLENGASHPMASHPSHSPAGPLAGIWCMKTDKTSQAQLRAAKLPSWPTHSNNNKWLVWVWVFVCFPG